MRAWRVAVVATFIAIFAATAVAVFAPQDAEAYSVSMTHKNTGKIVRWPKTSVPYWLHPACSTDLNASACIAESKASFAAWKAPCSSLKLVDSGLSTNKKLTAVGYNSNGKNEVAWIENSAWTYGKWVLGVTSPYFYTTGPQAGAITEADIAMNGYLHTWSMSGKSYTTDVKNVLVHEIGHFFGLQHNLYPNNSNPETMAPKADNHMKSRTPEKDDLDGLCYLYPTTGSMSCASNNDCPKVVAKGGQGEYYAGQIPCGGGKCGGTSAPIQPGGKKLGDNCSTNYDCDKPLFCQPLSGSQAVCSKDCNPNTSGSCPSGYKCYPYQNNPNKGACLKGSGSGGAKKNLGEACNTHNECKSQMCIALDGKKVCQQPCIGDQHCPSGQKCDKFPGTGYGACVNKNAGSSSGGSSSGGSSSGSSSGGSSSGGSSSGGTNPTKKADGDVCFSSAECQSLLCVGSGGNSGKCTKQCQSSTDCPVGFACAKLSNGKGGCFKGGDKKLGDSCTKSSDCAGGLCVSSGGQYICSQPCKASSQCPTGYKCYGIGGGQGGCFKGPTKKADGESCKSSTECTSGLCVGSASNAKCSQPCKTDSQCKPKFACFPLSGGGGVCMALGDKKTGDPCSKPSECASGSCVGIDSKYVCAAKCTASVDCACGFECTTFQSGNKYCTKGKKIACVENGDNCSADSECVSEKCMKGKCTQTCSIYKGSATCPTGKGCVRLEKGKPLGICSTEGPKGFGDTCGNDTFCKSLFCHAGKCARSCNPFGPNTCTLGLVCENAEGDVGHCTFPQSASSGGSSSGTSSGASSSGASSGASSSGASSSGASSSGASSSGASSSGASSSGSGSSSGGADAVTGGDGAGASSGGVVGNPPPGGGSSSGCSSSTTGRDSSIPWLLAIAFVGLMLRRRRVKTVR